MAVFGRGPFGLFSAFDGTRAAAKKIYAILSVLVLRTALRTWGLLPEVLVSCIVFGHVS